MNKIYKINENDNVAVALTDIKKGEVIGELTAKGDIPFGHKILLSDVKQGDNIIKYGYPIGHAKCDILAGDYVHEHNLKTNLKGKIQGIYTNGNVYAPKSDGKTFLGYKRSDGKVGTRNEIWIIPTVGCVNKTAVALEKIGDGIIGDVCDGIHAYTHPYGCSQMDDDQENTRKLLANLVRHPNAGGVLVLSLGCENTNINVFKKYLGNIDEKRIKFLTTQDVGDEIAAGKELIREIYDEIKNDRKEVCPIGELTIGYKCGGSDAFSGITANRLCGKVNKILTDSGATTILTEVPEMFGAENILFKRCENKDVLNKCVAMLNNFRQYFYDNGQECSENPSPGNHDGGITTLEEKSLGCVQKGGDSIITDILEYGDRAEKSGLNLLTGPGNDIVSVTNLTAAGAQIILFTTGRGTPLGAPVPTIKISSNTPLCKRKPGWIDFDAGRMLEGNADELTNELERLIISVANGQRTKNEQNGYREISIFKNGVIM